MPDAAPPLQLASPAGEPAHGRLSPERIERVLAEFRDWLCDLSDPATTPSPIGEPVDLHTLVGQFTALRHDVNLQTKASRSTVEQNSETIRQLQGLIEQFNERTEEEPVDSTAPLTPLIKALADVHDALALALTQVEKQKSTIETALSTVAEFTIEPPPVAAATEIKPGFFARLFGAAPSDTSDTRLAWYERTSRSVAQRASAVSDSSKFLKDALNGLLTGYSMSLNRIDRVLEKFGLEPIVCVGQRFDPELMEVIDTIASGERPAGEVIAEVRRGYTWNGALFRYAQVRVAR